MTCVQTHPIPNEPPLTFADFYAGIGGFHLGLAAHGLRCVVAAEINPPARRVYEDNFGTSEPHLFARQHFFHDIADLAKNPQQMSGFDILTAGFPCQDFSVAGKRRGFQGKQGGHFFLLENIIAQKQPRVILLENVQGLTHRNNTAAFQYILHSLEQKLGYVVHWKVLRACDFGLPQLRPRVFFVGFREQHIPFVFPQPMPLQFTLHDLFRGRCHRAIGRTILRSNRGKPFGDPFCWDAYKVDGKIRRISLAHALRMQGFPMSFRFGSVSENQAMELLGNSVAVPVVKALAGQILIALGRNPKPQNPHPFLAA
jgi:DNA (cytosine-5)-methyltransferase 1